MTVRLDPSDASDAPPGRESTRRAIIRRGRLGWWGVAAVAFVRCPESGDTLFASRAFDEENRARDST